MTVARTVLVTLATSSGAVDLVADGDVALADLLGAAASSPDTGFHVGEADTAATVLPSGDAHRSFVIPREQSLLQAGVVDGDVVLLHPPARSSPAPSTLRSPK